MPTPIKDDSGIDVAAILERRTGSLEMPVESDANGGENKLIFLYANVLESI